MHRVAAPRGRAFANNRRVIGIDGRFRVHHWGLLLVRLEAVDGRDDKPSIAILR